MREQIGLNTPPISKGRMQKSVIGLVAAFIAVSFMPLALADHTIIFDDQDGPFSQGDLDASQGSLWISDLPSGQPWGVGYPSAYHVVTTKYDRTYVTFEAQQDTLPWVTYYDHKTSTWATPVVVTLDNPVSPDDHGAPALWIDRSGYILVACCSHVTVGKLYRSHKPYDISTWDALADYAPLATYPYFFEYPKGKIYLFYRDYYADAGDWVYKTSTNHGTSWTAATKMLDMGGLDGQYMLGYGFDPEAKRLWWGWNKFVHASITREDVYACQLDLVTKHVWSTDGMTDLGTLVDATEADASCRIVDFADPEQSPTGRLRVFNGEPYVIYLVGQDDGVDHDWTWYIRYPDGAVEFITTDPVASSSYNDFTITDTDDIDAYLNTGIDTGCSGDCIYTGSIEHWQYDGGWSKTSVLMDQSTARTPVNFPIIPEKYHPDLKVLWGEFYPISIEKKHIWGWGDNGFVRNKNHQEPTYNIEVSTGEIRLQTYASDDFVTPVSGTDSEKWRVFNQGDGTADCDQEFTGTAYHASWTEDVSGTGRKSCIIAGRFQIDDYPSNTFDARAHFEMENYPDTNTVTSGMCVASYPDTTACITDDQPSVEQALLVVCVRTVTFEDLIRSYKVVDGGDPTVLSEVGTEDCSDVTFRITRTEVPTFPMKAWYSIDGGLNWVLLSTTTDLFLAEAYVNLFQWTNAVTSGTVSTTIDDFEVVTGNVLPLYFPKGTWTSPLLTFDVEVPKTITVDYTALAEMKIDAIRILNSAGTVLWSDETDVDMGISTSHTYTVPDSYPVNNKLQTVLQQDWKVQLSLKGNELQTPRVSEISILMGAPITFWTVYGGWIFLGIFLAVLVLMVIVGYVIKTHGIGGLRGGFAGRRRGGKK